MPANKKFDCVEMKNAIQTRHRKEHEGLSDEEVRRQIERKLAISEDPVARKWRSIAEHEKDTARSG